MKEEKLPLAPETFEGWAVLHELFRVNWQTWGSWTPEEKKIALAEAQEYLSVASGTKEGDSAFYSMLGHKADLLFLHFRPSFDDLNEVELSFRQLKLASILEESTSYVSYVELGVYDMTAKLHAELMSKGLEPDSEEWKKGWTEAMAEQRERMKNRLYPTVPEDPYLCFYPMNKRRGEEKNWYTLPMPERQRMMREHGMIGRKYAGRVIQVISGSIGFDDWEWGVDLFAKDPIVFKKLIYEMRFDEASAHYAEFGPFYSGMRFQPNQLSKIFEGHAPTK